MLWYLMPPAMRWRVWPRHWSRVGRVAGRRTNDSAAAAGTQQKQLAAVIVIDQGFVSRIEAGLVEPCLHTLATLAKAFEMTMSDLLKSV
jgi:hypothetical protein